MQGNEHSRSVATVTDYKSRTWTVEQTQALDAAYGISLALGNTSFEHEGVIYEMEEAALLIRHLVSVFNVRGQWPITGASA